MGNHRLAHLVVSFLLLGGCDDSDDSLVEPLETDAGKVDGVGGVDGLSLLVDAAHPADASVFDTTGPDGRSASDAARIDARPPPDAPLVPPDAPRPPPDAPPPPPDAADCIAGTTSLPNGEHNAGLDCTLCHTAGGAAQAFPWEIAGTLYSAASGGTAVAGATIRVVDSTGKTLDLVTASNGNFYTLDSVTFPLQVMASKCPSTARMTSQPSNGRCNSTSCHASSFRVHLP